MNPQLRLEGICVVHSVHSLLWALELWLLEHSTPVHFRFLKANFLKPILLDEQVQYTVSNLGPKQVKIQLTQGVIIIDRHKNRVRYTCKKF